MPLGVGCVGCTSALINLGAPLSFTPLGLGFGA